MSDTLKRVGLSPHVQTLPGQLRGTREGRQGDGGGGGGQLTDCLGGQRARLDLGFSSVRMGSHCRESRKGVLSLVVGSQ